MALVWALLLCGLFGVPSDAYAQASDSDLYTTNGQVHALALSGPTLFLGGTFTEVGPATGHGAPIDRATGQPASNFPRVNGDVYTILPDGAGGWYVGGQFTSLGGIARSNLAHVGSDHQVSSWAPSPNGPVRALATNGSVVLVGGAFTSIGGQSRSRIAAIDASNGSATAWNPNANGEVLTLAVEGSIVYAGGSFTMIGAAARNRIAALDLSSGSATSWNPNADGMVRVVAPDGPTVFLAGSFGIVDGQARSRLAAVSTTTGAVTPWNPGANGEVFALTHSGGVVYVGGDFNFVGGVLRFRIAAIDKATGTTTAWNPLASAPVMALATDGSTVYAGGEFATIGGQARRRLAALDATTGAAAAWDPNANGAVLALALSGTWVAAGGEFTSLGAQARSAIAAVDVASGAVTAWNPSANGIVYALAVNGSTVYAGGTFTSMNGQTRNRIAALDAATGTVTAWNPNASSTVRAIAVHGTTVYAGGFFGTIGGQTRNRIAALDATSGAATAWNPDAGGAVKCLLVDGSVVHAGGDFTTIGGQIRNRLAALDATSGAATSWDPNANGSVDCLARAGATLYAGGTFTTIGGQARNRLAALDATSGLAGPWDPNANGAVNALAISSGEVYAGGAFTTMGGLARNRLAAIASNGDVAADWDPNANADVRALALGSQVYVGGDFTMIAGELRGSLAGIDALLTASIDDVSVTEGNSGTTNTSFTVTLSSAAPAPVSIDYATADGTATVADGDYQTKSGTLSFLAGETTQVIVISVNGDATFEPDETFHVDLFNPSGTVIADPQGLGTIVNDDGLPSLSIADVVAAEGQSGTTKFDFGVTLSHPSSQAVTVDFATVDSSAVSGSDYQPASGTLTIPAHATSAVITVLVNGDDTFETKEAFFVDLSNPVGATLADARGRGTIVNDDPLPLIAIDDVAIAEGQADSVALVFTVTLDRPTYLEATVDFASVDGTAMANSDYRAMAGTLTIPAEQTSATLAFAVYGDLAFEPDETFFVNLSNPLNAAIFDGQGRATILNDDAPPELSIADGSLIEGNADTQSLRFTIRLSEPADQLVTVDYATADGLATVADGDYAPISGTAQIDAMTDSVVVLVTVNGDVVHEADETFFVNLSNPVNASIADGQARATIENDDPVPDLSISGVSSNEGNAGLTEFAFAVNLSNPTDQPVTVDFATSDGTASSSSGDYASRATTLTLPPKALIGYIVVLVNGDLLMESDETFSVDLANASNASIVQSHGQALIVNDDPIPGVSIGDVTRAERDSGTTAFGFAVTLTNPTEQIVTVDYTTADSSATVAGGDYQATAGTLTLSAGALSDTVWVSVSGDPYYEPDETFAVVLSNTANATIVKGTGLGTIRNDDPAPTLAIDDVTLSEGNGGFKAFDFTVYLLSPTADPVTVQYATADGSALASSDYQATFGTLTFPAQTTVPRTITVFVNGDLVHEANETLFVNLSEPSGATLANDQGVGTIVNDDALPQISIGDLTQFEGNADTTHFDFAVTLSNPADQAISVQFTTADGSATFSGLDYVAANNTLVVPALAISATLRVDVLGDVTLESDEDFFVNLSNPSNATIFDGQGHGTILNDDALPDLTIFDMAAAEGTGDTTSFTFVVTLSNPTDQEVAVDFATEDRDAKVSDGDYVATTGTLVIPAKSDSGFITVQVNGDSKFEANEAFRISLSNATNARLSTSQAQALIENDDPVPAISIEDVAAAEGDAGTTAFIFTVQLSNPTIEDVKFDYATVNGTASTADADFAQASGQLTIPSPATIGSITVLVIGDVTFEADETFIVEIMNPRNATIADTTGVGTILNDDPGPAWADATQASLEGNGFDDGVVLTDLDGDGDFDMYVTSDGPNQLLRNEGGGVFVDATHGALGDTSDGEGAAAGDIDNDGNSDLYLANFTQANRLFMNEGGGTFVDATTPPLNDEGKSEAVAFGDIDNDGDLDLYLVNFGGPNKLFRNEGGGGFVDATEGPLGDIGDGTGATFGDVDGDGDLDLYLANFGQANKLFRNEGAGLFVDATHGPLGDPSDGTGVAFGDVDNDGDLDLYLANSTGVSNRLFRNDGAGSFVDATDGPIGDLGSGRGVALGDTDGDGDLDLYLVNFGQSNKLFRNESAAAGNHWLHVDLVGTVSNRLAIGARVRLVAPAGNQMREISGSSGYLSQNPLTAAFGLGTDTVVDSLVVAWPSGIVQSVSVAAIDQRIVITEDSGPLAVDDALAPTLIALHRSAPNPFSTVTSIRFDLPRRAAVTLHIYDLRGARVRALRRGGEMNAGRHRIVWDGSRDDGQLASPGIYFVVFEADRFRAAQRVVLLR